MLVTFSGVDCAGKSTQLELLARTLSARGLKTRSFWFRPGYSPELNALKQAVRALRPGAMPTVEAGQARERIFSNPRVRRSWVRVALVDMVAQYAGKLRWLLARNDAVLCDRYLWDAYLDLELRFPELKVAETLSSRVISALVPRPDVAVLLTLPWDEMVRRAEIKNEPFPDPDDIRKLRFARYGELAQSGNVTPVDASMPLESVHREILERVDRVR